VDNGRIVTHPSYGGRVKDDASLHDEQLESEIRLVGDLVLAASQREGHMSQAEIDEVLGLEAHPSGDGASDDDVLPPGSKAS